MPPFGDVDCKTRTAGLTGSPSRSGTEASALYALAPIRRLAGSLLSLVCLVPQRPRPSQTVAELGETLVQERVRPLLLPGLPRVFDVGMYVLVSSVRPLHAWRFNRSLVRFCLADCYAGSRLEYWKRKQTLGAFCRSRLPGVGTDPRERVVPRDWARQAFAEPNRYVIKEYAPLWRLRYFAQHLTRCAGDAGCALRAALSSHGYDGDGLWQRMERVAATLLVGLRPHVEVGLRRRRMHSGNAFELFRFDFLVDGAARPVHRLPWAPSTASLYGMRASRERFAPDPFCPAARRACPGLYSLIAPCGGCCAEDGQPVLTEVNLSPNLVAAPKAPEDGWVKQALPQPAPPHYEPRSDCYPAHRTMPGTAPRRSRSRHTALRAHACRYGLQAARCLMPSRGWLPVLPAAAGVQLQLGEADARAMPRARRPADAAARRGGAAGRSSGRPAAHLAHAPGNGQRAHTVACAAEGR